MTAKVNTGDIMDGGKISSNGWDPAALKSLKNVYACLGYRSNSVLSDPVEITYPHW